MNFDPAKHHRRSIRLKGHDYSGGGIYFVTLCAHREFIAAANGVGARCISPVPFAPPIPEIIAEEWRRCGELRDDFFPGEFVVMPDHFHGLIEIRKGASELGHVIGAFKAAVSRRIRRGDSQVALNTPVAPDVRIWHRNYYEMIVRTPEAAENIRRYIRMNPWKCIQNFGNGPANSGVNLRGMGNPALWNAEKLGVLCSRVRAGCIPPLKIPEAEVYLGGFHSPPEQKILEELLKRRAKIIICPAWDLGQVRATCLSPLEENRMLILEMCMGDTHVAPATLAAAEQRNRFVIQNADKLWTPHVSKGGMLDRLLKELKTTSN
jgi:REP element-mobilizing transposase RayT